MTDRTINLILYNISCKGYLSKEEFRHLLEKDPMYGEKMQLYFGTNLEEIMKKIENREVTITDVLGSRAIWMGVDWAKSEKDSTVSFLTRLFRSCK